MNSLQYGRVNIRYAHEQAKLAVDHWNLLLGIVVGAGSHLDTRPREISYPSTGSFEVQMRSN